MAKQAKRRKKRPVKAERSSPSLLQFYLRTGLFMLGFLLIFWAVMDRPEGLNENKRKKQVYRATKKYRTVGGYQTLWSDMVNAKMAEIRKIEEAYPDLNIHGRFSTKFGLDYQLMQGIVQQTPDDAVIYIPPKEIWPARYKHMPGKREAWLSFFLYPRKVYLAKSKDQAPPEDCTHIVLVEGWGEEFVPYSLTPQQRQQVLVGKMKPDNSSK